MVYHASEVLTTAGETEKMMILESERSMSIIKFEDLSKLRKKFLDKKIVFCSGVFDLTHAGHVLFFEDCKKHGDLLFVCVGSDSAIKQYKGDKRPILNEHLRLKMIDSLKVVDFCFLGDDKFDKNDDLKLVRNVFAILQPDVYVFNTDGFNQEGRKKLAAEHGVLAKALKRKAPKKFESVSTSGIIKKIAASLR